MSSINSHKDKRYKTFEVPIINTEYKVYVYIGDKVKANRDICKYLKENQNFIETENRGKCIYKRGYHPCIWIDGSLDYRISVPTLTHEAIHAVSYIMDYMMMDIRDDSGNELLAHSVAAILRQTLKI